jgi:hypothetical protein
MEDNSGFSSAAARLWLFLLCVVKMSSLLFDEGVGLGLDLVVVTVCAGESEA